MQCGITTQLTSLIVIHIIFVIAQIILLVMDGNAVIILVELCILSDAVHGTMLMMDFDPGGAGKRVFNNCWAMSTDKYIGLGGIEGNGFKTGAIGEDQAGHYPTGYVFVEVTNCLAVHNFGYGFYNNLELGTDNNAKFLNNTSYQNFGGYFDVPLLVVSSRGLEMRNNLAYGNINSNYSQVGIYNPSVYTESNNTWVATQETGAGSWPGWRINPAVTVTATDFVNLDASQLTLPRKPDGSLPDITFLKLTAGSDLIDAGVKVGLPFSGSAPDIGYAEFGTVTVNPPVPTLVSAVIQNATPTKLEMTYSLTLAGIVPATSAFSVKVNTVTRTVSSVAVSGTKVTLTHGQSGGLWRCGYRSLYQTGNQSPPDP